MVTWVPPLTTSDYDTTLTVEHVDEDQINLQLEGPYESNSHTIEMTREQAHQLLAWLIALIAGE